MKKKSSIWDGTPRYGTYKGPRGNPAQWRVAFEEAMYSHEKALGILGDSSETPRAILGVTDDASPSQVKAAWRRLVVKYHPDHGGDRTKFEKVMAAYSLLAA